MTYHSIFMIIGGFILLVVLISTFVGLCSVDYSTKLEMEKDKQPMIAQDIMTRLDILIELIEVILANERNRK